ncbi:MAG: efflux RND transporter periplasmic adaptor subunit [Planctomycetota bacterium]|nr:efflux RND transporter periplasmic adaptor subunit [Planctomycetota bacterium]
MKSPGSGSSGGRVGRVLGRLALVAIVAAGVVVLMLNLLGYFHPKIDTRPTAGFQAVPVGNTPLVEVRKVSLTDTEAASGRIMPIHEAEMASQVTERIVEVNVKAGQKVKKGEVLVRLDDTVLRSRLQQAQANLSANTAAMNQAKAEEKRTRELAGKGIASQSDLDTAVTTLKTAEARVQGDEKAVAEAEATLKFTTITAPMDGVVIDRKVEAGDMAQPGRILVTIYDSMQIIANVRESLIGRLKEGQKVEVRIDRPPTVCKGTVSEIVPEGDPVARTFPVKVVGPCQPGIHKGMYAKMMIPLDNRELLVIPQSTVIRIGQLDVVEVAEGNTLRRRTVQLGPTLTVDNQPMVQVLSGLAEGEKVADHPAPKAASSAERAAKHE